MFFSPLKRESSCIKNGQTVAFNVSDKLSTALNATSSSSLNDGRKFLQRTYYMLRRIHHLESQHFCIHNVFLREDVGPLCAAEVPFTKQRP